MWLDLYYLVELVNMLIRIMWCHEREDNINKMLSSLPKKTEVIWDTDHNSCHTLQRVLDTNESILIMEDDIELCKNFYEKAKAEIDKRPDTFIMFYGALIEEIELMHQKKWIPYNRISVFTQAFYLPEWLGKELKEYAETDEYCNKHRYSIGISKFLKAKWIPRYLVLPSLVQHIWKESIIPWISHRHQSDTYKYE